MAAADSCQPICLTDELTGSNCYILSADNCVLIIDPNNFSVIQHLLAAHHWQPDLIFLTHEHCDHIAGLNELRQVYETPVLASRACSDGMGNVTSNMSRIMETYLYFKSGGTTLIHYPRFTCSPADCVFDGPYEFTWHDHVFQAIPVPGHTVGSVCLIMDRKQLFSGDYFVPGEEVITRLPGGDSQAYEKTGKKVLQSLPVPIHTYPGHYADFILTEEVKRNYGL